jgi:hypothetical protein
LLGTAVVVFVLIGLSDRVEIGRDDLGRQPDGRGTALLVGLPIKAVAGGRDSS